MQHTEVNMMLADRQKRILANFGRSPICYYCNAPTAFGCNLCPEHGGAVPDGEPDTKMSRQERGRLGAMARWGNRG